MATYQLVGSQDPASRIDRVQVEGSSEDYPEGKFLELHGAPQELSDDQYYKLSRFVRLHPVADGETPDVQYVDQPGVALESLSTDDPPNLGTAPIVGSLNKEELQTELARVQAEGHLQSVDPKSNKDDLAKALREFYGQEA